MKPSKRNLQAEIKRLLQESQRDQDKIRALLIENRNLKDEVKELMEQLEAAE